MPTFRAVVGSAVAALLLSGFILAGPASAGGSWIHPLEDRYEPGDPAVLQGGFGPGQLGWIEDGPFYAFLRVDPAAVEAAAPEGWPYIDPSDLLLGELQIEPGGSWEMMATVEFVVPDVEPGLYDVVYCNDPCTDGIGDLIGGTVSIGQDPPRPLSEASIAQAQLEQEELSEPVTEDQAETTPTSIGSPSTTAAVEADQLSEAASGVEADDASDRPGLGLILVVASVVVIGALASLVRRLRWRRGRLSDFAYDTSDSKSSAAESTGRALESTR